MKNRYKTCMKNVLIRVLHLKLPLIFLSLSSFSSSSSFPLTFFSKMEENNNSSCHNNSYIASKDNDQDQRVPSVNQEPPSPHQDSTQRQLHSQHELARSILCLLFHQGDFSMDSLPIHRVSPPDRSMSVVHS